MCHYNFQNEAGPLDKVDASTKTDGEVEETEAHPEVVEIVAASLNDSQEAFISIWEEGGEQVEVTDSSFETISSDYSIKGKLQC